MRSTNKGPYIQKGLCITTIDQRAWRSLMSVPQIVGHVLKKPLLPLLLKLKLQKQSQ